MAKLLLVENIERDISGFRAFFSKHTIDSEKTVSSAIEKINKHADEYDLFILDADVPEHEEERANNYAASRPIKSGAWKPIKELILSKLGEHSKNKILVRTAYDTEAEAIGTEIRAVSKSLGLPLFGLVLDQALGILPNHHPRVLMVSRYDEEANKLEKNLTVLDAKVERLESPTEAIMALRNGERGLYHMLLVQLDLPRDDSFPKADFDNVKGEDPFYFGYLVLREAHSYSPLTFLCATYHYSLAQESMSKPLREFGVSAVRISGKQNVGDFLADFYPNFSSYVHQLYLLGENPSNPDVNLYQALTLIGADRNGGQKTEIDGWGLLGGKAKNLILKSASKSTLEFVLSALMGMVGKEIPRHIIDCEKLDRTETSQRVVTELTNLNRQKAAKKVLVLHHAEPACLESDAATARKLKFAFAKCRGLHTVATTESGNYSGVSNILKDVIGNNWVVATIPDIGSMDATQFRAVVNSYLLSLGTFKRRVDIIVNDEVYANLRSYPECSDLSVLFEILNTTYVLSKDSAAGQRPRLTNAILNDALSHTGRSPRGASITNRDMVRIPERYIPLVQQLISDASLESAYPLGAEGKSGASLYLVRASYKPSGARRRYNGAQRVIKISQAHKIRNEKENYETWVRWFQDRNVARIENVHIDKPSGSGGILYSLIHKTGESDSLEEFGNFLKKPSVRLEQIKNALNFLFERLLSSNWYRPSKEDLDQPGFLWFYGRHLPPLLEAKIENDNDIFVEKETDSDTREKDDELWNMLNLVSTQRTEQQGELHGLDLPSYLYPEEDQTALNAHHRQGALIKIHNGHINWQSIIDRFSVEKSGKFAVAVRGHFSSVQRRSLEEIAKAGFANVGTAPDLSKESISLGTLVDVPNPLAVYQKYLKENKPILQSQGIIHGDLHWRNVLIEEEGNDLMTWLIDFGRTGLGPIVFDAIQLETDLLVNVIPDLRFSRGQKFDCQEVLNILAGAMGGTSPRVEMTGNFLGDDIGPQISHIIWTIRQHIKEFLPLRGSDKDWRQYFVGTCLYSLGFLRYLRDDGDDEAQKKITNAKRRICFAIAAASAERAQ